MKRNRNIIISVFTKMYPLIILLVILVVYLYHEYLSFNRATPPTEYCTIIELAEKVPAPRSLEIGTHVKSEKERLIWTAPIPPFTIRSGPPVYIFNDQGRLVKWTAETDEGWTYGPINIKRQVTLEEAYRWSGLKE